MILLDSLIPFLLQFESDHVYEKGHKVGHCHQSRLLLIHLLVSMAGCKPQGDLKLAFSVFAGMRLYFTCKKGELS